MTLKKTVLLLLTALIFTACSRADSFDDALPADLSHETIAGIQLGASIEDPALHTRFGETWKSRPQDEYRYHELSPTLEVATGKTDDTVLRIIAQQGDGAPQPTARGLKVGDSRLSILAKYGAGSYTRSEQGAEIVGYLDPQHDTTLEFWLVEDTIAMIRLDRPSMK